MNDAIDAMSSVGVSIRDMAGNIRPVSDIMKDLAGKWANLTDEERQHTAVSVAGKFQLTRFLALMNNFEMATSATTTAINSQGSAMKEQEKYSDSLEARINRLDTAWNKFTLSLGNAFLTDSLVGGIETLNSLATTISKFVNKFGALGAIFGIIGVATVALSAKFKTFTTSLIFGTAGMSRMQLASAGLTAGMTRLGIASVSVGTAFRGLIASTGIGLLFVGIGFAVEKLIGAFAKAKKEQEAFQASLNKDTDALTKNKQETEHLIDQYNGLTEAKKKAGNDWSVKQETQYLDIQDKLAQLYPSLISYIDGSGRSHLKSAEQIKLEIQATNELINAKKAQQQLDAQDKFKKSTKKRDDLSDKVDSKGANVLQEVVIGADKNIIKQHQTELRILEAEWSNASQKITSDVLKISSAYTTLQIDPAIQQSVEGFISKIDTSKLNANQLLSFSQSIGETTDALQKAYAAGDVTSFDKAKQAIIDLSLQMGNSKQVAYAFALSFDDIKNQSELTANAIFAGKDGMDGIDESALDAADSVDGLSGSMNGLEGATNGATDALTGNISAAQILFGVTSDQIAQMENAVAIVQMLSDVENLSAQQKGILAQATAVLAAQYPQLNGAISDNIDWIATQVGYMGALGNVSGQSAATMIKNQNSTTKATIAQINQRILGYKKEAQALAALVNNIEAAYETEGMSGAKSAVLHKATKRLDQINAELASANASLVEVTYGSGVKTGQIKIDKPNSTKTNSGAGSGKKTGSGNSKSKDNKIEKTINPFEDKLHDYDEDIKKSEAIQKRYKEGSKEWIAEEKKQIGFIEKKRQTVIAEKAALEKLLKTGKLDKNQKKEVNNRIKELTTSQEEYTTAIKENSQAIMENMINAKITATENAYNKEIAALQKKLDLMDEEDKKQERINRRKELQDQLDKAKSDTRYEYVDKNGKVQLTYDKAEVARIEKEKTDQEAAWKKEDERAALEKKIAELEVNRDKAIAALNKLEETYFKKSIKNADDMKKVLAQLATALEKTYKGGLPKHHTGGIVGSSTTKLGKLANQLFNAKSNEQVSLLKKGEFVVNPMLPHVQNNLNRILGGGLGNSSGQAVVYNYNMSNFTIQADNAQELFKNLDMHVRMNKS